MLRWQTGHTHSGIIEVKGNNEAAISSKTSKPCDGYVSIRIRRTSPAMS